jgi:hypothetical protein
VLFNTAIVEELSLDVLPYIMFLIAPILKRMSDQDEQVRRLVAFSFATLVKLMPLEESIPNPPDMPDELVKQREAERSFLSQLLGGGKLDEYALPIRINTELRQYQKDGVNWLAFLNKYNLHGILADGSYWVLFRRSFFRYFADAHLLLNRYGTWKDIANHLHDCIGFPLPPRAICRKPYSGESRPSCSCCVPADTGSTLAP